MDLEEPVILDCPSCADDEQPVEPDTSNLELKNPMSQFKKAMKKAFQAQQLLQEVMAKLAEEIDYEEVKDESKTKKHFRFSSPGSSSGSDSGSSDSDSDSESEAEFIPSHHRHSHHHSRPRSRPHSPWNGSGCCGAYNDGHYRHQPYQGMWGHSHVICPHHGFTRCPNYPWQIMKNIRQHRRHTSRSQSPECQREIRKHRRQHKHHKGRSCSRSPTHKSHGHHDHRHGNRSPSRSREDVRCERKYDQESHSRSPSLECLMKEPGPVACQHASRRSLSRGGEKQHDNKGELKKRQNKRQERRSRSHSRHGNDETKKNKDHHKHPESRHREKRQNHGNCKDEIKRSCSRSRSSFNDNCERKRSKSPSDSTFEKNSRKDRVQSKSCCMSSSSRSSNSEDECPPQQHRPYFPLTKQCPKMLRPWMMQRRCMMNQCRPCTRQRHDLGGFPVFHRNVAPRFGGYHFHKPFFQSYARRPYFGHF